jgi:ATP synthase protein I
MPEVLQQNSTYIKYYLYIISLFVLGYGVTDYKTIFAGLILGTIVSWLNHWILKKRIERLTKRIVENVENGKKMKKNNSLGTLLRFSTVAIAVFITIEQSQDINVIALVIGLMTNPFVIIIDSILNSKASFTHKGER